MFDRQNTLAKTDPQLWEAIQNENKRQEDHIELIASEKEEGGKRDKEHRKGYG